MNRRELLQIGAAGALLPAAAHAEGTALPQRWTAELPANEPRGLLYVEGSDRWLAAGRFAVSAARSYRPVFQQGQWAGVVRDLEVTVGGTYLLDWLNKREWRRQRVCHGAGTAEPRLWLSLATPAQLPRTHADLRVIFCIGTLGDVFAALTEGATLSFMAPEVLTHDGAYEVLTPAWWAEHERRDQYDCIWPVKVEIKQHV